MKKILTVCCVILILFVVGFGYLRFMNHRDITNFAVKYNIAHKAAGDYMVAVIATNVNENPTMASFSEKFTELIGMINDPTKRVERKKLAIEIIEIRKELDHFLSLSDTDESVASEVLLDLNTAVVKIKNPDLKKQAIEIVDLTQEYFDTVLNYKRTISAKSQLQKDLLQTLVADGQTSGFIAHLRNKKNQEETQKQNTEFENSDFGKIDTQLNTAFARFKGAANLK